MLYIVWSDKCDCIAQFSRLSVGKLCWCYLSEWVSPGSSSFFPLLSFTFSTIVYKIFLEYITHSLNDLNVMSWMQILQQHFWNTVVTHLHHLLNILPTQQNRIIKYILLNHHHEKYCRLQVLQLENTWKINATSVTSMEGIIIGGGLTRQDHCTTARMATL